MTDKEIRFLVSVQIMQKWGSICTDLEVEHILSLDKKTVVVVGGGFAGTALVKRLEGKLPDDYQVVLVKKRFGGTPLGLYIYRRENDDLMLLDLIGPLQHFPALIKFARRRIAKEGCKSLWGWITTRQVKPFQTEGANCALTDVSIPCQHITEGPSLEELQDGWWLTAGDTDHL